MRNILGVAAQSELFEFLESDPLLVFDYDGTLCPIAEHAAQAVLRLETRFLLKSICARSVCVLLSGRSRANALAQVEGIPFAQIVGSHGEDWAVSRMGESERRERVARAFKQLGQKLRNLKGVQLENKGLSLSVHYRHARHRLAARATIAQALSLLHGLRVIGGKEVFNLLPKESGGKGQALLELKKMFGKREALFIGDDLTDEEVFVLPARERILKIRVGYSAVSKADYYTVSQRCVDPLLKAIRNGHGSLQDSA